MSNQQVLWRRFLVGIHFFFDQGPKVSDRKQILRQCRKVFNRRLAAGGGEHLVDRCGREIDRKSVV
jgi:hypothetical protein